MGAGLGYEQGLVFLFRDGRCLLGEAFEGGEGAAQVLLLRRPDGAQDTQHAPAPAPSLPQNNRPLLIGHSPSKESTGGGRRRW